MHFIIINTIPNCLHKVSCYRRNHSIRPIFNSLSAYRVYRRYHSDFLIGIGRVSTGQPIVNLHSFLLPVVEVNSPMCINVSVRQEQLAQPRIRRSQQHQCTAECNARIYFFGYVANLQHSFPHSSIYCRFGTLPETSRLFRKYENHIRLDPASIQTDIWKYTISKLLTIFLNNIIRILNITQKVDV